MSIINDIEEKAKNGFKTSEKFYQISLEYYKLKVFQQLTLSLSLITKLFIIGGLLFTGFVFLTIAGTMQLSKIVGSLELACLIIGTFIVLISIVLYYLRRFINALILKKVSKTFFS